MRSFTLFEDNEWRLVRYGLGIGYALTNKDLDKTLYVQGDDADEFERDLGIKEEYLAGADLCDALWENQGGDYIVD